MRISAPNLLPFRGGEIQCGLAISLHVVRMGAGLAPFRNRELRNTAGPLSGFLFCDGAGCRMATWRRAELGLSDLARRMAGPHCCPRQHISAPKGFRTVSRSRFPHSNAQRWLSAPKGFRTVSRSRFPHSNAQRWLSAPKGFRTVSRSRFPHSNAQRWLSALFENPAASPGALQLERSPPQGFFSPRLLQGPGHDLRQISHPAASRPVPPPVL